MKKLNESSRRIAIDLVPIRVGEGGTGSGIWTYARELILHMDQEDLRGLEIICLVNEGQVPFLSDLQQVRLVKFPGFGKNIPLRLLWIHLFLPLVCLFRRFGVLHKLATETPLFCPAKRVTTVHDFYYEFLMENHPPESIRLYEQLENLYFSLTTRSSFKKSRTIIAVSEATRQEAIKRYPAAADRIHVIHHGVTEISQQPIANSPESDTSVRLEPRRNDLATKGHTRSEAGEKRQQRSGKEPQTNTADSSSGSYLQPPASNLQPDDFNILCVAKFMEHKGQLLLIHAFEEMLRSIPKLVGSVRLILRGFHNDAVYYHRICEAVSKSIFARDIKIMEFNASDSLSEIYKEADLVVLLSSYEGFGLPVLEAQGMGIPVLCSELPVLREVGGEGATYVSRANLPAVADAMQNFVDHRDYYETMRGRALENIKRFSWDDAAKHTISVYKSC